jgi:hypothetical protein
MGKPHGLPSHAIAKDPPALTGLAGWTPRRRSALQGVASNDWGLSEIMELGLLVCGGRVPRRPAAHFGQMMDNGAV